MGTEGEVKMKRPHRKKGLDETSAKKERFRSNVGEQGEVSMKREPIGQV